MKSYIYIKKILDFIFALILLIIVSPIMLCVATAIKLNSPGPILFKQKRPVKR
jgi:lipopolysaccharide/colanic/teichoic acid biosynthesis glycosyltransferase